MATKTLKVFPEAPFVWKIIFEQYELISILRGSERPKPKSFQFGSGQLILAGTGIGLYCCRDLIIIQNG